MLWTQPVLVPKNICFAVNDYYLADIISTVHSTVAPFSFTLIAKKQKDENRGYNITWKFNRYNTS